MVLKTTIHTINNNIVMVGEVRRLTPNRRAQKSRTRTTHPYKSIATPREEALANTTATTEVEDLASSIEPRRRPTSKRTAATTTVKIATIKASSRRI